MTPRLQQPYYLVFGVVLGGLAATLGGPLAFGALWCWLFLGAADLAWSAAVGHQLAVLYRTSATRFTRGEPMGIAVEISNEGWLFAPVVSVRDQPGAVMGLGTGPTGQQCTLGPQRRNTFAAQVSARRRQYRLGPLEVSAEGPFGIFAWSRMLYSDREITVLPRLQPLPFWPLEQAEVHGHRARLRSPYVDPTTVTGTRPTCSRETRHG